MLHYRFSRLVVTSGESVVPQVRFHLNINGEERIIHAVGKEQDNPQTIIISEILRAIDIQGITIYHLSSINVWDEGVFKGKASVKIGRIGKSISVEISSHDQNTAIAEALITALNSLRKKQ